MYNIIDDINRDIPLPSKPFIKNLGQICFFPGSAFLAHESEIRELATSLTGRFNSWDPKSIPHKSNYKLQFFSYDSTLKDQRMNLLYFELHRPIFIKAKYGKKTQAQGKIFIHIYPSGYIIIHIAIALIPFNQKNFTDILRVLREIRPESRSGQWVWVSRVGYGKLFDIVKIIKNSIYQSFFTSQQNSVKESSWYSALKFATTDELGKIIPHIFHRKYDIIKLNCYPYLSLNEYILASKQGIVIIFSPGRKRYSSIRYFWKIMSLYEFILLKHQIYEDYTEFLRSEIMNLRESRISFLQKLKKEGFRKFSVYNPLIPRFLFALDKQIRFARPFYRKIYSSISKNTGFDERREKLKILVKEWELEVEQWNHSFITLWKKVFSPLKRILK